MSLTGEVIVLLFWKVSRFHKEDTKLGRICNALGNNLLSYDGEKRICS
jgi:hypothetical protein